MAFSRSLTSRYNRWLFRHANRRRLHGVSVGVVHDDKAEVAFEKIGTALELLGRYDAATLKRLRRHADGILVWDTAWGLAEWHSFGRLIVCDGRFIDDELFDATQLASTLVHETTHARLDAWGIRYAADQRAKIEAICFRRQLAFVRRVPDADALIAPVERQLARPAANWSDESFRERHAAALVENGVPRWFVRLVERISPRGTR